MPKHILEEELFEESLYSKAVAINYSTPREALIKYL